MNDFAQNNVIGDNRDEPSIGVVITFAVVLVSLIAAFVKNCA